MDYAKYALLVFLVLSSAFFASSEAALFSLGLQRVRRLRAKAKRSYQAAHYLLNQPSRLISTLLTGNELINTAIGVVGSTIVYEKFAHRTDHDLLPFLSTLILLPIVLIFGEIIPKTFGIKHPEIIASWNALPLSWFSRIVYPIVDVLERIARAVFTLTGNHPSSVVAATKELFRSMVDVGHEEGVLDIQERRLLHNVIQLDDVPVSQIMTPQSKVISLRAGMKIRDALHVCRTDRFSRLPVLDTPGKTVLGIFHAKDLLVNNEKDLDKEITSYLRAPLMVHPEQSALELFAQFRARRSHFAIVSGSVPLEMIGVVTLDDVLERILHRGATSTSV